jgi:hypothetical protein
MTVRMEDVRSALMAILHEWGPAYSTEMRGVREGDDGRTYVIYFSHPDIVDIHVPKSIDDSVLPEFIANELQRVWRPR